VNCGSAAEKNRVVPLRIYDDNRRSERPCGRVG
jgi:hypothetical protein